MIAKRSLAIHLSLFIFASALGLRALTKGDDEVRDQHETELWTVTPEKVSRLEFTSDERKVVLESKTDAEGRYFITTVDRLKKAPPHDPHRPPPASDAGAPSVGEGERETLRFIAVQEAEELAESVASLTAKRSLGKLEASRFEEFGFEGEAAPTVRIDLAGESHELVVGGRTPGGGDVYVMDKGTGDAYVVAGNIARNLESAESSLIERNLVRLEEAEVHKVVVKAGDAQRALMPIEGQKGFWANPDQPTVKDETASNWMSKLDKLRISEYVAEPANPTPMAQIEYYSKDGKRLATVELASESVPGNDQPRYLAKSSNSRWYGTVLTSVAEQLSQDLSSILNP